MIIICQGDNQIKVELIAKRTYLSYNKVKIYTPKQGDNMKQILLIIVVILLATGVCAEDKQEPNGDYIPLYTDEEIEAVEGYVDYERVDPRHITPRIDIMQPIIDAYFLHSIGRGYSEGYVEGYIRGSRQADQYRYPYEN